MAYTIISKSYGPRKPKIICTADSLDDLAGLDCAEGSEATVGGTRYVLDRVNGWVEPGGGGSAPFLVTLTPTSEDFSGTMDKTPQEITAAHEAGRKVMFNVVGFPGFDKVNIPAAWFTYATGDTICAACATLVDIVSNLQIIVFTSDIEDEMLYDTRIYPLTP